MKETGKPGPDIKDNNLEELRRELETHIETLEEQLAESKRLLARVEQALGGGAEESSVPEVSPAEDEVQEKEPQVPEPDETAEGPTEKEKKGKHWTMEDMLEEARRGGKGEYCLFKYQHYGKSGIGDILAFKAQDRLGYYIIPQDYAGYILNCMEEFFDGIPEELNFERGEGLIEVIEMPYMEGVKLNKNISDDELEQKMWITKGKVKLTEDGEKKLELNKEIFGGPPLRTEEELRASDWEKFESDQGDYAIFASRDGKWICITPSLHSHKMKREPSPLGWGRKGWEKLSDTNYVAAYIWREKMGKFDPANPYDRREIVKYETITQGKIERK